MIDDDEFILIFKIYTSLIKKVNTIYNNNVIIISHEYY